GRGSPLGGRTDVTCGRLCTCTAGGRRREQPWMEVGMVDVATRQDDRTELLDELLAEVEGPLRSGRERLVNELLDQGYDAATLREAQRQDRLAVLLLDDAMHESAVLSAREVADVCRMGVDDVLRASRLLGMLVPDADTRAYD